jgi:nucleoside-triphosphatase THEP1
MVLVLTGPVHAGKTGFLERAVSVWTRRGLAVAGFLSPAAPDAPGGPGYDLVEIGSARRRPYLRRQGPPGAERVGPFVFVPETIERARTIIRSSRPEELLVVDEIGPLELGGGGLWPALRDALGRQDRTILLVVREDALPAFSTALAPLVPVVFDIRDTEDRRLLDERLTAGIAPHDH